MGAVLGTIGLGANAVSAVGNPILQHYETNRQMHFQSDESAINRDWQTVEAEKARQFSAEQLQKQMDYNSPVYQAGELRKAGLNPVISMSNGSAVASVSGGSSSPSASPVQGVSPVQGQPVDLNIPQAVQSMGAFLKSIADAKKTGVETDYLEQTFYDAVAKFHSEQTLQSLEVASKEMDNYIKHRVKDAKIEQAWQELEEVGTRVVMNQATAQESFSRSELNKALERMNDALAEYHGENALYVKLQVENFYRDFESMLKLRGSEIAKNRSSAAESRANAAVLKEEQRIRKVAANIKEANSSDELDTVLDELHAKQAISLEQYNKAQVQLHRLDKLLRGYKNSENLQKVDAILQNFFTIIGLNTSVSASVK